MGLILNQLKKPKTKANQPTKKKKKGDIFFRTSSEIKFYNVKNM